MTHLFLDLVDLASDRLGAAVIAANDEFFAPKENLVRADAPRWREGEYTERGKWMDGWETRRRRDPGDDWCIIRLGVPGIVRGVNIDTTHFKGNYPEAAALDGVDVPGVLSAEDLRTASWFELLSRTPLAGDRHNLFPVSATRKATHVQLRIFPDGGVARLRVHGDVVPDWERLQLRGEIDLAAVEHGGAVVGCSDMFFGSRHNLILPGDPRNMGDGWETKRRRGPGYDWIVIRLGAPGIIRRVEIDTRYFKGNAPGACSLDGTTTDALVPPNGIDWRSLHDKTALRPDARHNLEDEVRQIGSITHVRLNIFPDGGVARLRVFGRLA